MTNYLLRQGQGSPNPLIFMCFSELPKSHFLSPLGWQMTGHWQRQTEFCCWHNSLILSAWPGSTIEDWQSKTRREQPKCLPTSILCDQLCCIKNSGFCGNIIQQNAFQLNKSAFPDGKLCAERYWSIQGSYGDSIFLLTKKYAGIRKGFVNNQ